MKIEQRSRKRFSNVKVINEGKPDVCYGATKLEGKPWIQEFGIRVDIRDKTKDEVPFVAAVVMTRAEAEIVATRLRKLLDEFPDPNVEPKPRTAYRYAPRYRPPDSGKLPDGWRLVGRGRHADYTGRLDVPMTDHKFGVIEYDRPLTDKEIDDFELDPV